MLIDFSVSNYKSIKDEIIVSFIASSLKELPKNITKLSLSDKKNIHLLTAIALYGANASGKSNILEALECAAHFVISSATKYNAGDEIPFSSFRLNEKTVHKPSVFKFTFLTNNTLFQYSFSADLEQVYEESLYYWPKGHKKRYFYRVNNIINGEINRYANLKNLTRENALVISVGSSFNNDICKEVYNFFNAFCCAKYSYNNKLSINISENNIPILSEMIKFADIGVKNIEIIDINNDMLNEIQESILGKSKEDIEQLKDMPSLIHDEYNSIRLLVKNIKNDVGNGLEKLLISYIDKNFKNIPILVHNTKDDAKNIYFTLDDESDGTIKFLFLLNKILDTMNSGGILIIDEFDAKIHPLLAIGILKFFQNIDNNRAQIIFSTHSPDLLDGEILRRDQIYITEKNRFGETTVISLSDYKIWKDAILSKRYLEGRYGGIPYLHDGYLEKSINMVKEGNYPSSEEQNGHRES